MILGLDVLDLRAKTAALSEAAELRPHQEAFVRKIQDNDSVLALHGTGTGKTFSSIAGVEALGGEANAIMPAALRGNYRKDLSKFVTDPKKYNVQSFERAARPDSPIEPKPILVADEVQRLRNQGRSYEGMLNLASQADKRILLSATPIVNSPGDLASVLNLLHGKQMFTPREFENRYVGEKVKRPFLGLFGPAKIEPMVKHKEELLELLKGRVHYIGDVKDTKPQVQEEEVRTEMSPLQDQLNKAMMGKLPLWARWKIRHNLPPKKKQATQLNAFLGGMRQVGLSPHGFDKRLDPHQAFMQSPKMQTSFNRLQTELQANPEAKVAIYSNFIDAGITPYAAALQKAGIPHVKFDGTMNDAAKKAAIEAYNNGKARVVLLGPAGAEGISLRGTTQFHSLDPHWHQARDDQAQARAVRLDSHVHLPAELRNVRLMKFLSDPRRNFVRRLLGSKPAIGSDQYLSTRAAEKQQKLDTFIDVLREAGA